MSNPSRGSTLAEVATTLRGRRFAILSGAGISTESGVPDYRGPKRKGKPATPIRYQEFVKSEEARRRYWARSAIGWPWMRARGPNAGHLAVAQMEKRGLTTGLITQNVDGFHQKAGSRDVIELHGSLKSAVCLECGLAEARDALQERMLAMNPTWRTDILDADSSSDAAPDGDIHLDEEQTRSFCVPSCVRCGGVLKPDLVFFGESVPGARVDAAFEMLEAAAALLVVGSSLTVFSGYRFVDRAVREEKPVVIINDGPTRGDAVATAKVEVRLGVGLPELARLLRSSPVTEPSPSRWRLETEPRVRGDR